MSLKGRLRTLVLCLPLLLGSIAGVPMRPEEIENLMHSMNQQKIVVTISEENENSGYKLPKLPGGDD
jgi:hypothetical protein